jgi:hypothetical protein
MRPPGVVCLFGLTLSATLCGPEAAAQASAVPRGSYSQTCTVPYVVGGRLFANCRNTSGATVRSSIPLTACTGQDVANINGVLTCGATAGRVETASASAPSTGPTPSITVYLNRSFSGASRTYTAATPSLFATMFNDQISSMRVTGGWMACTEPDYRGQCQSFTGTVTDLSQVGMDNVISSMRPLR